MEKVTQHQPVLLAEVIKGLAIKPSGIYVDATFGRGGHSKAILACLGKDGKLLVLDKDPEAIKVAKEQLGNDARCYYERASFGKLQSIVERYGWMRKVNGILLDLGVSSPQLDDAQRGFSFMRDGPLDMRMDPASGVCAASWLNTAKESEIAFVLKEYGEERFARRIAAAIVRERALAPINTTGRLAAVIAAANPAWEMHKHPATRSFQAIRIFINQELQELTECLNQCLEVLSIGGRLAVISFHSLEDRLVKRFIRNQIRGKEFPLGLPIVHTQLEQRLRSEGRTIKPSAKEVSINPRARSAILRIAEKIL